MTIPQVPMQLMVETKERKADLYINGDITSGFQFFGIDFGQETDVSYQDIVEALNSLPDEVDDIYVHINSYGGEVAEGIAIYNALKSNEAKVTTICEGFACSIASVIFMAGDVRMMREASLLMLHNASMSAHGDSQTMRKAAEDLETITELSKTAYLSHATEALTREKLTEVMDAETWVSPETALEWGLATEVDHDEDEDSPTQSARASVMQTLTGACLSVEHVDVPYHEMVDEIVGRITEQLALNGAPAQEPTGLAQLEEPAAAEPPANPFAQYASLFDAIASK